MASLVEKEREIKKLKDREEKAKKVQRMRVGPYSKNYRPIWGKYKTNPGLRAETENIFRGQLARKELEKEHFQLSPITVTTQTHFTPIKEGVDTRKDSDSSRSFGKLTPQPPGSPIFDTIHRERILKKRRSPITSPKNYPGIKGTGKKASKEAREQFKKTLKYRKNYDGGKRRKTRKRKRRRKRKTRRKKKRKSRKRKKRR